MLVKFDPPLGELYWAIDKQKPQDYYSFGIISKPKAYQKPRPKAPKSPTSIDIGEAEDRGSLPFEQREVIEFLVA